MSRQPVETRPPRERILVCGVLFPEQEPEHDGPLSEAKSLAAAAGAEVVEGERPLVQRRPAPDASTLMGRGKVDEVRAEIERLQPDAVLVDNDLSPAHIRNLEKAWQRRVLDRSELILDIFAARARTAQARLQVELAQMEYLRPRLKRMWPHLERTEGAIGTRGPGETQLETDRRLIAKRIQDLKGRLREIEEHTRRLVKSRSELFTVGLVGYTNAGKSTLLNELTGADEFVADMPFATLDTRTRQWRLSDGRTVLLCDTVGFVQRLPHHLVASFHATLEEALEVELLLHVVDAAHPDAAAQVRAVDETLAGLTSRRSDVLVLNKLDLVAEPLSLQPLSRGRTEEVVLVSAKTGEGLAKLEAVVLERVDRRSPVVEVRLSSADGRGIAALKAAGRVLEQRVDGAVGGADGAPELVLRLRLLDGALGALQSTLGARAHFAVLEPAIEPFYRGDSGG
jgi:GTP-binding protein HflX